jgi:hypothetical protein
MLCTFVEIRGKITLYYISSLWISHKYIYIYIYFNNSIPGKAPDSRWGVESGKLIYPSTFGHVPTCAYMSQMSRSLSGSRGSNTYPRYTVGWKISDKNLEQRINFMFCVRIYKSASETLALLTFACIVRWGPCPHSMARPRVADLGTASNNGGYLQIYWISSRGQITRGGPPAWGWAWG